MRSTSRRKLQMGARALEFAREHSDGSQGYAALLKRLEEVIARANEVAAIQREGMLQVRAATARKVELRRDIRRIYLDHIRRIAQMAAQEEPGLAQTFTLPRESFSYPAFRTAARSLAEEAESRKELMVKYGLSEPTLAALIVALDELDQAIILGDQGRTAHVGASAELETLTEEVVRKVRSMNGVHRHHFAGDSNLLAAWESASNVTATPRPDEKQPEGPSGPGTEVRPAA